MILSVVTGLFLAAILLVVLDGLGEDVRLRGPGEFIGARQSGLPLLRYADLEDAVFRIFGIYGSGERERTVLVHRFDGVQHQVHHHLLHLSGRSRHLERRRQLELDLELVCRSLAHPLHGAFDDLDQVEGVPLVAIGSREALEGIDDVARELGAFHRAGQWHGR